uniref:NADH-ubiquinone oxidoreductase chain 2 n=1 Tax=Brookesia karchei TaxID=187921 RepID=G7Z110_9SAUR|nr:NADH dehydrogenase subunit 2 [Brookesia karchei]AER92637.1 NADH dehydrogenase subunit 2 [Brookesia karchei]
MLSPLTQLIFTLNLIAGTIITTSSHHWLTAWAGLELNMLAILAIILQQKHPRTAESSIKYFLIQTIASATMLFSGTINAMQTGQWDISQLSNKYANMMSMLAMLMKIGAVPIYFWLPEVMQGTTMKTALIIATWQKVAPITIIFMMSNNLPPKIMIMLGTLSIMVGGFGGINQTQLRKLMAYSSLANLGWTMVIIPMSPNTAMLNIILYMTMLIPTFFMMEKMMSKTLQDTTTTWTTSLTMSTLLMLLFLSLSGLPPMTGFTPKLLILNQLILQNLTPIATTVATLSLISLFFYMRTTYTLIMTTPPTMNMITMKWRHKLHHKKLQSVLMIMSLMSLPLLPTMMAAT